MSSRHRILHVIDKLSMDGVNPSSVALCFIEWFKHADTRRFEVMAAVLRPPDAASKHLEDNGVRLFYIDKGKYSFANVGAIADLVKREKIDLLHLHGYGAANFGRLAAKRLKIPALVHEWAILKIQPHQFVMDWLLRNKTDLAVGVSESVREFLISGRHVPAGKTSVVWNGVNLNNFKTADPAKVKAFRQKFGIADHQLVIGTMTRLREEKGNRYFVEAAGKVAQEHPEARFIIAGDGPLREELAALATQFNLNGKLHFAGFVSEVAVAFAAFDIAVMASLTEGFPFALAEAMAAGRPVVVTAVGGMKEMVQNEVNGLLVPAADGVALALGWLRLLRDQTLREKFSKAARERSQAFSVERNVLALEELYSKLLSNGRA